MNNFINYESDTKVPTCKFMIAQFHQQTFTTWLSPNFTLTAHFYENGGPRPHQSPGPFLTFSAKFYKLGT